MAIYPKAVWRPLPENRTQAYMEPRVVIWHTAVDAPGRSSLFGYFARTDVRVETHFFIRLDGSVEQYMDTERRADGNRHASAFAISIEFEDEGNPEGVPMTEAQLKSGIDLTRWCSIQHDRIPLVRCTGPYGEGVGYHTMWGAPSAWTPSAGKTCPGKTRIHQFEHDVLPRLLQEEDMPLNADDLAKVDDLIVNAETRILAAVRAEFAAAKRHRGLLRDGLARLHRRLTHGKTEGTPTELAAADDAYRAAHR